MFSDREDTSKKSDTDSKTNSHRNQELKYCPDIQKLQEITNNAEFGNNIANGFIIHLSLIHI